MADHLDAGVQLALAQLAVGRDRSQLGDLVQLSPLPAERLLEQLPRRPRAGAPATDVYPLAGEIDDGRDARVLAREDRHHLRVQREHGPQAQDGPAGPFPDPGVGYTLDVRLQDRKIELAGLKCVDVVDAA